MEVFQRAKAVRLKSCHDKYLTADEDEESVVQDRRGSAKAAKWTVEFVDNGAGNVFRLKSCYGKYLTASTQAFLLGMTGRKVVQTAPEQLDGKVEWEAVKENGAVKLRTRNGKFLRANGGVPPWRNSVTHDGPHRTITMEWCVWEVHVLEFLASSVSETAERLDSAASHGETRKSDNFATVQESNDDVPISRPKAHDGRLIYFHVADENGIFDEGFEELFIAFRGIRVDELTRRLENVLGLCGITVCGHNPLNKKLYPLHLQLPPNNTNMHLIVIPSTTLPDGIEGGMQHHNSLHENAKAIPMMMA